MDANDANILTVGSLGDIQATSIGSLNSGNSGTFNYPSGEVTYTGGTQAITFGTSASGYKNSKGLIESSTFPIGLNGGILMTDGPYVVHRFLSGLQPTNFFMSFTNLVVSLVTSVPCPKNLRVVNVTACMNCQSNSVIIVKIDNKCLTGSATFKFLDTSIIVNTPIMTINSGLDNVVSLSFKMSKNYTETKVCVNSNPEECVDVTIRAPYQVDLRNNSMMIEQGFNTTGNVAFDSILKGMFSPLNSLFNMPQSMTNNIIWFIVVGVLILIAIIIIALLTSYLVKRIRRSKGSKEYSKKTE